MKRILSVILCLAVFLSSMVIGVISTASAEGAGSVVKPATTVTATGAPESVGTLEGVTAAAGELKADEDGNYYLTGDITVDSADDLAAVKTALNAGKTFDGKGYTITTSVPLFDTIKGGTLKNFTVKGEIKATEANVVNLGQPGVGVIVCGVQKAEGAETATINFENINIAAKLSYSSAPAEGVSAVKNPHMSGFVGFSLGVEIYFKDCAVTGYIGSTAADIESKVGGFIGRHETDALGYFENCTMSAEVNAGGHFGGFIADQNGGTKSATFKNCVVDLNVDNTYRYGTAYSGALIGYGRSIITVENCKVIGEAKLSDAILESPDRPFGGVVGRAHGGNNLTVDVDGFLFDADIIASDMTNAGGVIGVVAKAEGKKISINNAEFSGSFKYHFFDDHSTRQKEVFAGAIIGYFSSGITEGVYLTNCRSTVDATFDINKDGTNATICYALIGRVQNDNIKEVVFDGCYNTGKVTVNSYVSNKKARNNNIGGLLGLYHTTAPLTIRNCYNTGDLAVYRYNSGHTGAGSNVAGLVAYAGLNAKITIIDSYNTGKITIASRSGSIYAGGIISATSSSTQDVSIENCYNTGDVSATLWNGNGRTYDASKVIATGDKNNGVETTNAPDATCRPAVGGIVGQSHGKTDKLSINNVLNTGDVTATHELNQQARAGGIIAALYKSATVTNTFNAGNVALNTTYAQQPAGGIIAFASDTDTFVVENCVNIGDVTSTSTYYAAGIVGTIGGNKGLIKDSANFGTVTGETKAASITTLLLGEIDETFECGVTVENVYSVADDNADAFMTYKETTGEGEAAVTVIKTRDLDVTAKTVAELPAYCTPDNTKSVNAKAYITLVFANIDADLASAYVADEFKGDKEGEVDRLNNLIQPDVIFGVTFDKDLYDAIEAIVGDENVKVEGIVTLSKYVDKIGAFTHEALDAYYAANAEALAAKNVTKLYMDATRTAANIGSGDLVDGDYFVNIRLIEGNAGTVATTYTARAFIQIGDLYIYSSIIADAE